jgi:FkbM family methyltransferase
MDIKASLSAVRHFFKKRLDKSFLYAPGRAIWTFSYEILDYVLFKYSFPLIPWVKFSKKQMELHARSGFSSQYGQDVIICTVLNHLGLLKYGGCSYIDIGCNHPVLLSNSFFLERLGCRGVAIDPQRALKDQWDASRSALFVQCVVSKTIGTVGFYEIKIREGWEHALSGIEGHVRLEDVQMYGAVHYDVPSYPLAAILPSGFEANLLLIDVEGAEMEVLAGIDFNRVRPSLILLENNDHIGGSIIQRNALRSLGYSIVARIGGADDLWINSSENTEASRVANLISSVQKNSSAICNLLNNLKS